MWNKVKSWLPGSAQAPSTSESQPLEPLFVDSPHILIGDVHGCLSLLNLLYERLESYVDRHPEMRAARVVFFGDYIDRGNDSAAVLDHLFGMSHALGEDFVCLRGNHEQMLLDFLENPEENGPFWVRNGGLQTLASYRIGGVTETSGTKRFQGVADDLRAAMPAGMLAWLHRLPTQYQNGSLVCVHAALDPMQPMSLQTDKTRLWGHKQFRHMARSDGFWVAHGHTITAEPGLKRGRLSLDTGAYATGRLTAAAVSGSQVEIIST